MTPCPEWCQEGGEHSTHRRRLTNIIATGGLRHEGIRLGLVLSPGRRYVRPEMIIYRGKREVLRFQVGQFYARHIAKELIKAADVSRSLSK